MIQLLKVLTINTITGFNWNFNNQNASIRSRVPANYSKL
jgi:hypothetical protein